MNFEKEEDESLLNSFLSFLLLILLCNLRGQRGALRQISHNNIIKGIP